MNSMPPPETMKVLKPLRAQVGEQFQHRLIDHLGVEPPGDRMLRGGDPVFHDLRRIRRWSCRRASPSRSRRSPVSPPASAPFTSPLSSEAKGSFSFHSGCCGASSFDSIEREQELKIHRLLGPERAVVVEGGDALILRHKVRRAFRCHPLDKVDDRLFPWAVVVPRGKRIATGGRANTDAGKSNGRAGRAASADSILRRLVAKSFLLISILNAFHDGLNDRSAQRLR